MAKLCPKGKAAAKRKFKVYPSAYANMYASAVCSGKVTPGGKKKRKKLVDTGRAFKFKGGKEIYSIRPGENPKVKFKDTIAKDAGRTPTKKFKKGKELREKKMGGGMMGRRMGYSDGSGLKDIPPGKKFKGLRMLPKEVRNKMKYKKDGGKI